MSYLTSSPGPQLGMWSTMALVGLALVFLAGIMFSRRRTPNLLTEQIQGRLGIGIACWAVGEAVLILWRFTGLEEPRVILYSGLLLGGILFAYGALYLLTRGRRDQRTYASLRDRALSGSVPPALRAHSPKPQSPLDSGWAQAAAALGGGLFYISMYPSTDHALHWFALIIGATMGFGAGLILTAGQGASGLAMRAAAAERRRKHK